MKVLRCFFKFLEKEINSEQKWFKKNPKSTFFQFSKDWLQTWPPGAPLWPAANDANDANDASRRTWTLKTASPKNEVEHHDGEVGFEDVNEAYELRIEDEALELLASSQVWKPRKL